MCQNHRHQPVGIDKGIAVPVQAATKFTGLLKNVDILPLNTAFPQQISGTGERGNSATDQICLYVASAVKANIFIDLSQTDYNCNARAKPGRTRLAMSFLKRKAASSTGSSNALTPENRKSFGVLLAPSTQLERSYSGDSDSKDLSHLRLGLI